MTLALPAADRVGAGDQIRDDGEPKAECQPREAALGWHGIKPAARTSEEADCE